MYPTQSHLGIIIYEYSRKPLVTNMYYVILDMRHRKALIYANKTHKRYMSELTKTLKKKHFSNLIGP